MQEDSLTTPNPTASVVKSHDESAALRWKKGELIGCGAYGRVYVGMNLDTGELLAVKQVSIAANHGSRDKAQAQIRELEEEVKLLRNLSHQNIVRYLGTAREEEALNILLEFVPGGSISSLLGKFGSFTEPVIRKYTKQLLQGLEYLHSNGIMHRDIKGANILVDNKGCIKLADFGASKKVVELATISGAKSMKGTPYWMAPEVIRQTGHGLSADIWSVGCTVIEMATGKPPWSQQFQEVAALFHIGTTKSHPPIPDHLSPEAKDFLLKCLKKEPNLRPSASELVKHPFILGSYRDIHPLVRSSMLRSSMLVADQPQTSEANSSGFGVDKSNQINDRSRMSLVRVSAFGSDRNRFSFMRSSSVRPERENTQLRSSALDSSLNLFRQSTSFLRNSLNFNSFLNATKSIQDMPNLGSVRSSIGKTFSVRQSFAKEVGLRNQSPHLSTFDEDMNCSVRLDSVGMDFPSKSFNPMSEPLDEEDWGYRLKELGESKTAPLTPPVENDKHMMYDQEKAPNYQNGFSFRCARLPYEDDDEVTESKIRAFLDEKALELKKLQTPLYEEFYNTMNAAIEPEDDRVCESGSPLTGAKCSSHSKSSNGEQPKRVSDVSVSSCSPARAASSNINPLNEISSPKLNEWKGMQEAQQGPSTPSSFSERQRLWKEELDQELERKREELRKRTAANGGKILSPKFKLLQRQKDRWGCTAPRN